MQSKILAPFSHGLWHGNVELLFFTFQTPAVLVARRWQKNLLQNGGAYELAEIFDEKLEVTNPARRSILRSNVNLSEAIYEHKLTSSHKGIYKCISEMYYVTF
jgi:hypothetical protein